MKVDRSALSALHVASVPRTFQRKLCAASDIAAQPFMPHTIFDTFCLVAVSDDAIHTGKPPGQEIPE